MIRYVAAECVLGCETYQGHSAADGPPFQREYFLVAGKDVKGYGLRRSPFEEPVEGREGFTGDETVISMAAIKEQAAEESRAAAAVGEGWGSDDSRVVEN